MSVRYQIWGLLSPSQLILLSLAIGAALLWSGRARLGRWLAGFGIAGLVAFGFLPGAVYLAVPLQLRFPQPELPARVTGIILLTGAEIADTSEAIGLPQLGRHGDRYVATLRLANRYPDARVIVSGGPLLGEGRSVLGSQTGVSRRILDDVGIPSRRVLVEQASTDTCKSAVNTKALVQPKPGEAWIVVTSAMHMPRTIACFRAAGWPEVIAQPDDYEALPESSSFFSYRVISRLMLLDLVAHEWAGLAYYRLTGRTEHWFPAP